METKCLGGDGDLMYQDLLPLAPSNMLGFVIPLYLGRKKVVGSKCACSSTQHFAGLRMQSLGQDEPAKLKARLSSDHNVKQGDSERRQTGPITDNKSNRQDLGAFLHEIQLQVDSRLSDMDAAAASRTSSAAKTGRATMTTSIRPISSFANVPGSTEFFKKAPSSARVDWTKSDILVAAMGIISSPACDSHIARRCLKLIFLYSKDSMQPNASSVVRYMLQVSDFIMFFERATIGCLRTMHQVPLVTMMYTLAVLECRPSNSWIQVWMSRAELMAFDDRGLSNSIYALAKLEIHPTKSFLQNWFVCFAKKASLFTAQSLANTIWAFGKLNVDLDSHFLELWNEEFKQKVGGFSAHGLASVIWAAAKLRINPNQRLEGFLDAWYLMYEVVHKNMNCQSLANIIWSFGKLEIMPSASFMSTWAVDFARQASVFNAQELANILWGFARVHGWSLASGSSADLPEEASITSYLFRESPTPFFDLWFQGFEREIYHFSPQGLANVVWSFGRLNVQPHEDFWDLWFSAFAKEVGRFSMQSLCNSIWAMARLEHVPSVDFMDDWYDRFFVVEADADAQDLANSLWSLAKLGMQPDAAFMELWYIVAQRELSHGECTATGLSMILWAFGTLEIMPRDAFMEIWYTRMLQTTDVWEKQGMANAIGACIRLKLQPRDDFVKECMVQCRKQPDLLDATTLRMFESTFGQSLQT